MFVLSGAEDLVPVAGIDSGAGCGTGRGPRGCSPGSSTSGTTTGDYWEVRSRDGLLTRYGTPRPADADPIWRDPAVARDPGDGRATGCSAGGSPRHRTCSATSIRYDVRPRSRRRAGAPLGPSAAVSRIAYADYGDRADPAFLVTVDFDYEPRPDPFSDYRAGFEIRTTLRCRTIRVSTHAADGVARVGAGVPVRLRSRRRSTASRC